MNCKLSLAVTVVMGGLQVPASFPADTSIWYAPGVGLVKLDGAIAGMGNSTIELTAYRLP